VGGKKVLKIVSVTTEKSGVKSAYTVVMSFLSSYRFLYHLRMFIADYSLAND